MKDLNILQLCSFVQPCNGMILINNPRITLCSKNHANCGSWIPGNFTFKFIKSIFNCSFE